MTVTETDVHRRHILTTIAVFLAGCRSGPSESDADQTPTSTDTATPTDTALPDPGGWSVRFSYDGDWQGSVSVTTASGDSHQAFDGQGETVVDVENQLGVETEAVQDIVVTAQKRETDDQSLHVAIRKDGDVVAESSTDSSQGQVMVSHHMQVDGAAEGPSTSTDTASQTATETESPTATDTDTSTDEPAPDQGGWSVRIAYDGRWQGTITVTTAGGDSHQAFEGQGETVVDVESRMGVDTGAVEDVVVQAQKQGNDYDSLHVAIRRDGDVVAESSTDSPRGQVMVSHHE